MHNKVKFKNFDCYTVFGHYADNKRISIRLVDKDYLPVATATVNIPNWIPPDKNYTLIKDYSENIGIAAALEKSGVIKLTGETILTGYVSVKVAKVLKHNLHKKYEPVIYQWPESQGCMGCENSIFVEDVKKYGPSAYICNVGYNKFNTSNLLSEEQEIQGIDCAMYESQSIDEEV